MENLNELFDQSQYMVSITDSTFVRYLYDHIDWEARLVGIKGARGIGKTTLLLQRMRLAHNPQEALYVTADHFYFASHRLFDLGVQFAKMGGRYLFVDEIHKYKDWSRELKMLYDLRPDLHVVFTGSSVLDIDRGEEADLSRRALMYPMYGLSFREYMMIFQHTELPLLSLEQIVAHQTEGLALSHPLQHFSAYLQHGYYPFGQERNFKIRLLQTVEKSIEVDIPYYANMNVSTARKLKQLLTVIAGEAPFKPNYQTLSQVLDINRTQVKDYLLYLEKAGLVGQLRDDTGGIRSLGKVDKVYLDNPNLCYLMSDGRPEVGTLRETFFFNQLYPQHQITTSRLADFEIGDMTFEVGGKKKGQRQVREASAGYVVKDDIEFGMGNILPLWHFGLTY